MPYERIDDLALQTLLSLTVRGTTSSDLGQRPGNWHTRVMRWFWIVMVVAACSKETTGADVTKKYAPKIAAVRASFSKIADLVDAQGPGLEPEEPNPPMVFDPRNAPERFVGNTDFVMYEELRGPYLETSLAPSAALRMALAWAHFPDRGGGDPTLMTTTFEGALAVRYLVVIRAKLEAATTINSETYESGKLELDGLVIDMTRMKVIGSVSAYATSPEVQHYAVEVRKGTSERRNEYIATRELSKRLGESLINDAQEQIVNGLAGSMHMKVIDR